MAMLKFFTRWRWERTGFDLYGAAVTAARQPRFYVELGVPDTLDGRFDMIGLHAFLLVRRLLCQPSPGQKLAQAVFDAMFADMDTNLREMGVGDMSVGRKVRTMWEAFNGRSAAYGQALDAGDLVLLHKALARNVWRVTQDMPQPAGIPALADYVLIQEAHLSGQDIRALSAGRVHFRDV